MPRVTTASLFFAVACASLVGISPSDSRGIGAQRAAPYEVAALTLLFFQRGSYL